MKYNPVPSSDEKNRALIEDKTWNGGSKKQDMDKVSRRSKDESLEMKVGKEE